MPEPMPAQPHSALFEQLGKLKTPPSSVTFETAQDWARVEAALAVEGLLTPAVQREIDALASRVRFAVSETSTPKLEEPPTGYAHHIGVDFELETPEREGAAPSVRSVVWAVLSGQRIGRPELQGPVLGWTETEEDGRRRIDLYLGRALVDQVA